MNCIKCLSEISFSIPAVVKQANFVCRGCSGKSRKDVLEFVKEYMAVLRGEEDE